jgi:uncharacterized membrane protein
MSAMMAVQPVLGFPVWAVIGATMAAIILIMILIMNKMNEPGESLEPTPRECWKAAVIYYNPNDAALFVEKHAGVGYTFNFGNPWSWIVLSGIVLVIASSAFLID